MKRYFRFILWTAAASAAGIAGVSATAAAQDLAWPAGQNCTHISTYYGYRASHFHSGIDIACGGDIDILAAADGKVVSETNSQGQCQYSKSAGTCVSCKQSMGNSLTIDHGNGYQTIYMHLKKKLVKKGDEVSCGDVIAKMGTTGCSTGQHLHFTVKINGKTDDPFNHVKKANYTCPAGSGGSLGMVSIFEPQNTDIDGDGVAEICIRGSKGLQCIFPKTDITTKNIIFDTFSDEKGWNDVSNYATIRFADVNGDDKSDVCARSNSAYQCWLSNGTGFTDGGSVSMSDKDGYNDVKYYATTKLADINADGKFDFCARFKDHFNCYLSTGEGFSDTPIHFDDMGDAQGWGKPQYYMTIRMADINGDGMADVCGRSSSGVLCWPSNGDSFGDAITGPAWTDANWEKAPYYSTIRMPDINGDHKADLCARDSSGVVCHLSTDEGFGDEIRGPEWSDSNGWKDPEHYATLQFGDINGDGMDDICARADAGLICHLSNGNGFEADSFTIDEFGDAKGGNKPAIYRTIHIGDIDGDGKMDICGRNTETAVCFKFNGEGFDRIEGAPLSDSGGWNGNEYASTYRLGGPKPKDCSFLAEICDEKDNNCNGEVDEGNVCCEPSEEICDGADNDCDGEVDEDGVCCVPEVCDGLDNDCDGEVDEDNICCEPTEEICDRIDNDCDGQIDEDNVCCEPSEEVCDGEDNDCDGQIDEDDVCNTEPDEKQDDNDEKGDNNDDYKNNGNDTDEEPDSVEPNERSIHVSDDCSSQPQGTSSHPMPWLLGFGGLLGMMLYRRRRENSK